VGRGRYSEPDVAALARMLTGWSYYRPWEAATGVDDATMSNRGQFVYRPLWHEEGPVTFMGKVYPDDGMKQAQRALTDLAGRTETAENIAFKLVRHFITDKPTPAMADPIKRVFLRTGGDLKAVSLALLDLPEAWSAPLAKLRSRTNSRSRNSERSASATLRRITGSSPRRLRPCISRSGHACRRRASLTTRWTGSLPTGSPIGSKARSWPPEHSART